MDVDQAIDFVKKHANGTEQARLRYLLADEPASDEVIESLLAGQHTDGGWSPFWAPGYSSLDATCFRLAQAEQMGISGSHPALTRAAGFLIQRQHPGGSWEEDASSASQAPPWAKPGDVSARLYLTANCGFWLAILLGVNNGALRAADFLQSNLAESGQMASFLHTHWLACGLWHCLDWQEPFDLVISYLGSRIQDLSSSSLAWLIITLSVSGVPGQHELLTRAASSLQGYQQPDGRWPSEDGPERDVHATLEALRALKLCAWF